MATIYPRELRADVRNDPRLTAEVRLFDELKTQLGHGWYVFYHVAWLGKVRQKGLPRDGEADFIIYRPDQGILLLEIKGGGIRYDGAEQQWWSRDRYGQEHKIKDPFEQAVNSKHALLRKLESLPGWKDEWLWMGHGVVFPDVIESSVLRANLPAHAQSEIILTHDALDELPRRLREVMAYWRNRQQTTGSGNATLLDTLIRVLAPVTELPNPLKLQIEAQQEEVLRLTERQFLALSLLSRSSRVALGGCAGAGKTTLAVEKARRLAQEGFRTLLTCYSEPLGRYLAELTERYRRQTECLDVASFDVFCRRMADAAGITLPLAPAGSAGEELRSLQYPLVLEQVMREHPELRYDAIIVDEGQDFYPLWWPAVDQSLRDGMDGILYIFYDDNQRVHQGRAAIPTNLQHFPLSENVRNTRAIHRRLVRYYQGDAGSLPLGPAGRQEERYAYEDAAGLRRELRKVLKKLTDTEGVPPCEIAVLTPRLLSQSLLPGFVAENGIKLVPNPVAPKEIQCASIADFKGLERSVVVVAELERSLTEEDGASLFYVALSRPRHHLVLLGHHDVLDAILT